MKTMKAMAINKCGSLDEIKEMNLPIPEPLPHEVQIKVAFAGVNPVDWKITEGMLQGRIPHEFPLILGWEASGVVFKLGSEVTNLKLGDPVYAYTRGAIVKNGTFAEYVCYDAKHVVKKPAKLDFAQAAGIPLTALTAWQSLIETAKLKKGETILIHAGAGGVGGMAIQIAHYLGAKVITTARTENHAYVKRMGADLAIDYTKENFVTAIRHHYPKGVDVVFDCAGGETLEASYEIVKPKGRLISIVGVPDPELAKKFHIEVGYVFVRADGHQLKEIAKLFDEGKFISPALEILPLAHAVEALEQIKQHRTRGKIVLEVR